MRRVIALLSLVAAVVLATGCGSDTTSNSNSTQSNAGTAPLSTPAPSMNTNAPNMGPQDGGARPTAAAPGGGMSNNAAPRPSPKPPGIKPPTE